MDTVPAVESSRLFISKIILKIIFCVKLFISLVSNRVISRIMYRELIIIVKNN